MKRMTRLHGTGVSLAALALAAALGGCQNDTHADGAEQFLARDETSAVTRIVDRQKAAGARTDATLRAYHFDDARLNSLGREKIGLILDGAADGAPFDLYVDVSPDVETTDPEARQAAVIAYLEDLGVPDRVRLMTGPNPNNTVPAASLMPEPAPDPQGGMFEMLGKAMSAMAPPK
jgi:hypothetical protein